LEQWQSERGDGQKRGSGPAGEPGEPLHCHVF